MLASFIVAIYVTLHADAVVGGGGTHVVAVHLKVGIKNFESSNLEPPCECAHKKSATRALFKVQFLD
jgi:hypothetical protein